MQRLIAISLVVLAVSFAWSGCATDKAANERSASSGRKEVMTTEDAPAPPPATAHDIMRAKTAWAASLLEAIAMRNYELVQDNADALRQLSEETSFIVQDTVTYRAYSEQFRTEVAALADAARRRDQAQVEAGYARVTESCFQCHEYVRSERFQSPMPGRVSMR
ncbi:MAG: cytochrome c [Phycisphaerae bacterium]|nr:cytochrome c [Phycisphaerae bacterium]